MKFDELLKDHYIGNSDFQDYYLVTIRAGGTEYGMYKQVLRQLYKSIRGLRETVCDREIAILDIPKAEDQRTRIENIRATMRLDEADRLIENQKRELRIYYNLACHLKQKIAPDHPITQEERWKFETELWEFKVKEMLAWDVASGHSHPSPLSVEHMTALPTEMRMRIFAMLKTGEITTWYLGLNRDTVLPSIEELLAMHDHDEELFLFEKSLTELLPGV